MEDWICLKFNGININHFKTKEFVANPNDLSKNRDRIHEELDESRDGHERKKDPIRYQPNENSLLIFL